MAALTGNSVGTSYQGLIKTTDNAALDLADRAITDGVGNEAPLKLSTQAVKVEGAGKAFEINDANFQVNTDNTVIASADGVSQGFAVTGTATTFGGNVDFTSATVTGLPDDDTTYTIDTAQSGSDATITLTGSDASTDTITLAAGTNITLTEAGDTITIDAAGGGSTTQTFKVHANGVYDNSAQGPYTFFSNTVVLTPIMLDAGHTFNVAEFEVKQAFPTANLQMGIYDVQENTNNVAGRGIITPKTLLADFGTVSGATVGIKSITGINFTAPYSGIYFIAICVPGVWDGALGGFGSSQGNPTANNINAMEIFNTGYLSQSKPLVLLRDTASSLVASYANNYSWNTTSGKPFMGLKTS